MNLLDVISSPVVPVGPGARCGAVYDRFQADTGLVAIPVVDALRPIGILRRVDFLTRLADRYGRPLYEKRPVVELMDNDPLMVDDSLSFEALNQLLVESRKAVQDGFIIIRDGCYRGVGTGYTLLQANMLRAEERMRELEAARIEAEAATRARTQFLANMSHELRTPLNAIIGFAEFILSEQARGRSLEESGNYINDIRDSGRHLLGVINSILDLSKLEANAFVLREDFESPLVLANEVLRMMDGMTRAKEIKLILHSAELDVDLYADLQVVRQILINLLSNAIKFSPAGSTVDLIIKRATGGGIEFLVSDEGPGMAPQVLEKVQEPFVQADEGLARRHDGTGLGLPLVKAFMEAHGGRFLLTSALGIGTRAIVTFPSARSVARQAAKYAVI
ncbi:MAG: HAMP domain-containing histidine kinase [Alphaproteobacteria bacterium]|nr:MAG: HAMP domain-containing histidine kinase [Alphaproteobacteria bacterium]